jgi:hypothetical protein
MHRDYHAGMQANPMLSPLIRSSLTDDSNRLGHEALKEASIEPGRHNDRLRLSVYVLVMLVALITGYVLGLLGGQPSSGSRVDWPSAPANPSSLNP